ALVSEPGRECHDRAIQSPRRGLCAPRRGTVARSRGVKIDGPARGGQVRRLLGARRGDAAGAWDLDPPQPRFPGARRRASGHGRDRVRARCVALLRKSVSSAPIAMLNVILVFDLDDTLYPERQFALSGFAAAERWAQSNLGLTGLAADMTRLLDQGHLGQLFRLALSQHLPEHEPEHLADLITAYRNHAPTLTLFDDASWALSHFPSRLQLGLITDGTHGVQRRKVEALGIASHFRGGE